MDTCCKDSLTVPANVVGVVLPEILDMEKQHIKLKDGELIYFPQFLRSPYKDELLGKLLMEVDWKQDSIRLFGKKMLQPRLTAFFGETGLSYTYSGLKLEPKKFTDELEELKSKCENYSEARFNVCLANLYRDGQDSMGWHADDEKELGRRPVIASVSLGAERIFHLKHKTCLTAKHKIRLQHGSLLIMKGTTQEFWKHQLPKTTKEVGPRINLTFRKIY